MAALLNVLPLGAVFLIGGHGPFDLGYVVPLEQSRCCPEVGQIAYYQASKAEQGL